MSHWFENTVEKKKMAAHLTAGTKLKFGKFPFLNGTRFRLSLLSSFVRYVIDMNILQKTLQAFWSYWEILFFKGNEEGGCQLTGKKSYIEMFSKEA